MANENIYSDEFSPQPRPGMSTTGKLVMAFGLGCGLFSLLICGGIILLGGYFAKLAAVTDPAKVRELAQGIVSIEIPAGLKPEIASDVKIPFTEVRFTLTKFGDRPHDADLSIMQIVGAGDDKASGQQMRVQMEAQSAQRNNNGQQLTDTTSEDYEHEVHGSTGHFKIVTGKNNPGAEYNQIDGEFKGADGPAMLVFRGPAKEYSKEDLKKMLDSMK